MTPSLVDRLLVLDDHPIVLEGLARLLNRQTDIGVVVTASSIDEAFLRIAEQPPDAVVVDLTIGGEDGLEFVRRIRERLEIPILLLSMHDENVYAERALRVGASGYVMKSEPTEVLLAALRRVLSGGTYFSEAIRDKVFLGLGPNTSRDVGVELLSNRELQVFRMLGEGLSTRRIADRLHLSVKTIETHRAKIKVKLGCRDGSELLREAVAWVLSGA